MDYLKRQILMEVTQEMKKRSISKCNASNTPDIISSIKSHIQTLESEINILRSELQEKNALVKSLVTSYMLHENVETNPRISPSKIIGATEFCSSGQVSNSDDVIDFHINYHIKYQR